MAVGHLGLTPRDAWHLTITEFTAIADIRAQIARAQAGIVEAPTAEEVEDTVADLRRRGVDV
jgi:hypothetical protein